MSLRCSLCIELGIFIQCTEINGFSLIFSVSVGRSKIFARSLRVIWHPTMMRVLEDEGETTKGSRYEEGSKRRDKLEEPANIARAGRLSWVLIKETVRNLHSYFEIEGTTS